MKGARQQRSGRCAGAACRRTQWQAPLWQHCGGAREAPLGRLSLGAGALPQLPAALLRLHVIRAAAVRGFAVAPARLGRGEELIRGRHLAARCGAGRHKPCAWAAGQAAALVQAWLVRGTAQQRRGRVGGGAQRQRWPPPRRRRRGGLGHLQGATFRSVARPPRPLQRFVQGHGAALERASASGDAARRGSSPSPALLWSRGSRVASQADYWLAQEGARGYQRGVTAGMGHMHHAPPLETQPWLGCRTLLLTSTYSRENASGCINAP